MIETFEWLSATNSDVRCGKNSICSVEPAGIGTIDRTNEVLRDLSWKLDGTSCRMTGSSGEERFLIGERYENNIGLR